MKAFANLSIRNKLVGIVLVATILSVGTGFTLIIVRSVKVNERELIENTQLLTNVVGTYSAIDLLFKDPNTGRDGLAGLIGVETVSAAVLYDDRQEVFIHHPPERPLAEIRRLIPPLPIWPEPLDSGFVEPICNLDDDFLHCFGRVNHFRDGQFLGTVYLRVSTAVIEEEKWANLRYMGTLIAAVVIAAGVLAWLLQRVISKPILHLAALTQQVSEDADYSVRVEKPGNDEIGVLYEGFNEMLEQIQKRQEELERSNRDLDQFAYVASHDLKAPLRAISTLSGWIEEDLVGKLSDEASEQMRLLRSRVERMDHLIEGILQYSRAGRLDDHGEEVDVGEMVREIVDLLDLPDGFRIRIAADLPTLLTKRLRLEQVFSNLITNAIKYHDRQDGEVEVTAGRVGRFYEFAVTDNGPGIAPEHHEKVFLMFQTLQPRDQVESTGLGLSLVKKLVEDEGGEIRLESDLGQGASFRFTWPAARERASSEDERS